MNDVWCSENWRSCGHSGLKVEEQDHTAPPPTPNIPGPTLPLPSWMMCPKQATQRRYVVTISILTKRNIVRWPKSTEHKLHVVLAARATVGGIEHGVNRYIPKLCTIDHRRSLWVGYKNAYYLIIFGRIVMFDQRVSLCQGIKRLTSHASRFSTPPPFFLLIDKKKTHLYQ